MTEQKQVAGNGKSGNKRTRPTREEILERKINMARERGARVIKVNSPLGSIMFNVLRQFDQAYASFKGKLGEPGGISHEDGAQMMEKARDITIDFSDLTRELSKKIGFRYYIPEELKAVKVDDDVKNDGPFLIEK
ncbi:recombinase [Desulforhopalus sp. 52FAK]